MGALRSLIYYFCTMSKRVIVGLSGGVDSSVAAYLLQQQGYEVIGLFMKNWHDASVTLESECPWIEDSTDALLVAEKLGIPFQVIDLSEEYKQRIVDYMFYEYEQGRTPNPDVLCNREIKFDVFLKKALALGADYVATGHYCRKTETQDNSGNTVYHLLAGKDGNKDQSYFLCQLTQEQLSKALFPIGELEKPEVRRIAKEQDLITADKKDSQGLCFIGKVHLPEFLQQKLDAKEGNVIEILSDWQGYQQGLEFGKGYEYTIEDGHVIGKHNGAHFYTIGQRRGLAIGGRTEPLFVIGTDVESNIVYVGQGNDHPGLYRPSLRITDKETHWVRPDLLLKEGEKAQYKARIRYRQPLDEVELEQKKDGLYLNFKQPQKGIAAGQFAAWYKGEELIGSGVISAE
jgi:tRNA-specific 2-thiouridylase